MNINRILTAFNNNSTNEKRDNIWNECIAKSADVEMNEHNLENMCNNNFVYGYGGGYGANEVKWLAEALGVSGIQNEENNRFCGKVVYPVTNVENLTTDEILDKIQEVLPFKIDFPEFYGNSWNALRTKYGLISNRHIYYLWVLKRIMELCPDKNTSIIEIGAGFGILGYYLDKLGYKDYTTIDLALVNACQTYFIAKNLPQRELILSGEVTNPFDKKYKDCIKLLHATDFKAVPKNRFDIMINTDGLTEYGREAAEKYIQSDCAPMLFSINHEVNTFRVCEIKQDRKMIYRYAFWLRSGWVEELYKQL